MSKKTEKREVPRMTIKTTKGGSKTIDPKAPKKSGKKPEGE